MAKFSELIFGKLKNGFIHTIFFFVSIYFDLSCDVALVSLSISHSLSIFFFSSQWMFSRDGSDGNGVVVVMVSDFFSFISQQKFLTQHCCNIVHNATHDILLNVISMESFTQFVILPFAWGMRSFVYTVATATVSVVSLPMPMLRWAMNISASINTKHFWRWSSSVRIYVCISVVYFNAIIAKRVSNGEKKSKREREKKTNA